MVSSMKKQDLGMSRPGTTDTKVSSQSKELGRTKETPKVLFSRRKLRALRHFALFHVPPVAGIFAILALYIAQVSFNPDANTLSLLVLAARIHESLVLVSLSDILSHRIRYDLINSRGVAFGFVSAPFQLTSVRYLASEPFLASLQGLFSRRPANPMLGTVVVTAACILLAILTGMSSTILVLPKQAWFQVSPDAAWTTIRDNTTETVYITASLAELYPTKLTEASLPRLCSQYPAYDGQGNYNYTYCPFMGFNSLYQMLPSTITKSDWATLSTSKMQNAWQSISTGRTGGFYDWGPVPGSKYVAGPIVHSTSPMDLVAFSLYRKTYFWTQADIPVPMKVQTIPRDRNGRQGWKQPRVSVRCSSVLPWDRADSDDESENGQWTKYVFNGDNYPPFNLTLDQAALDQIGPSPDAPSLGVTFLDLQHLVPFPISAAFVTRDFDPAVAVERQVCLIDARWISADVWLSWPVPQEVQTDSPIDPQTMANEAGRGTDNDSLIRFDPSYISALNIRHNLTSVPVLDMRYAASDTNSTSGGGASTAQAFDTLALFCRSMRSVSQKFEPALCPALQYSLYFTDALARQWSSLRCMGWLDAASGTTSYVDDAAGDWEAASTTDPVRARGYTAAEMLYFRYAYAYRLLGAATTTLCLAVAVELCYVAFVLGHLLVVLCGDGWHSSAWFNLGDLLALAAQGRPTTALRGAGVGVGERDTWRLRTFVRETEDGERIELVLGEVDGGDGDAAPRADVKYG